MVFLLALCVFAWSADKLRQMHPKEDPVRALAWLVIASFAARMMGFAWEGLHAFDWTMGLHLDLALWALVGLRLVHERKPKLPPPPTIPQPRSVSDKR